MKSKIFLFMTFSFLGLSGMAIGQRNYEKINVHNIQFFADNQQLDSNYVSLSSIRKASVEGSGWHIERASGRNRGGSRIAKNKEAGILFFFWDPVGKKVPITNISKDGKVIPKESILKTLRDLSTKKAQSN